MFHIKKKDILSYSKTLSKSHIINDTCKKSPFIELLNTQMYLSEDKKSVRNLNLEIL